MIVVCVLSSNEYPIADVVCAPQLGALACRRNDELTRTLFVRLLTMTSAYASETCSENTNSMNEEGFFIFVDSWIVRGRSEACFWRWLEVNAERGPVRSNLSSERGFLPM